MAKKAAKAGKQKGKAQAVKYPRIDERAAENFVSLQEIVATARRNLSPALWDHLSGGSDSETTLWRNRQALDSLALRQRVLVDVRKIDITTTLLGKQFSSPVFLAPVGGFVGFAHPQFGELNLYQWLAFIGCPPATPLRIDAAMPVPKLW